MPKRSVESRIERYAKKIRKLEERRNRRRIIAPLDTSSDEGGDDIDQATNYGGFMEESSSPAPNLSQVPGSIPVDCDVQKDEQPVSNNQDESTSIRDSELEPEVLSALGEYVSDNPEYGDNIHSNLSKLWLPVLKKGMPKDHKEKTIKEYLIPDNCRLLQAPKLNAEISAALPDMVRNRDKSIAATQYQLGIGITAINRGIDILLKSDNKVEAMKHLSNGCRLLCDSHSQFTMNRIKLITPSLDRTILHMISDTERDETLFGSSLSEKIKAAKAIEKQGQLIKKPTKTQGSSVGSNITRPASLQGNWSTPPRYPSANRGGRGGYKKQQLTAGIRRPYVATPQAHRFSNPDKSRAAVSSRR